MLNRIIAPALALTAALTLATAASAAPVFQDTFDTGYGNTTQLDIGADFLQPNWTSTSSLDYLVSGSSFGELCRGAGGCIDLDGTGGPAGVLSTVASFAAGTYELSYELFGSLRGSTESVLITLGSWSQTVTLTSDEIAAFLPVSFTTTGGKLTFANAGGDNVGAVLSGVTLSAVPLPAGGLLLLGALAGFGALRRRKTA